MMDKITLLPTYVSNDSEYHYTVLRAEKYNRGFELSVFAGDSNVTVYIDDDFKMILNRFKIKPETLWLDANKKLRFNSHGTVVIALELIGASSAAEDDDEENNDKV